MEKKISIAIDAMGGENAPKKNIEGLNIFYRSYSFGRRIANNSSKKFQEYKYVECCKSTIGRRSRYKFVSRQHRCFISNIQNDIEDDERSKQASISRFVAKQERH